MNQPDLIPADQYSDIVRTIDFRLPRKDFVTPSLVAAACDVSTKLVYAWIQEGLIDGVNIGSGIRPSWKISRASVLDFYRRRSRSN